MRRPRRTAAKAEEEARRKAEEAWRKRLEQARKEEAVYKDVIDKLQVRAERHDRRLYSPGRAAKMAFLEENKQKLAETQAKHRDARGRGPPQPLR